MFKQVLAGMIYYILFILLSRLNENNLGIRNLHYNIRTLFIDIIL